MLWTWRSDANNKHIRNFVKEKCDKAVPVHTWKTDWVDAAWRFMANDQVIQWSDYNVSCLDTLGCVTAGNSRLARRYQNYVGTHHSHLQSRIDETIYMENCISLYR